MRVHDIRCLDPEGVRSHGAACTDMMEVAYTLFDKACACMPYWQAVARSLALHCTLQHPPAICASGVRSTFLGGYKSSSTHSLTANNRISFALQSLCCRFS
jgi:hypothetical protein